MKTGSTGRRRGKDRRFAFFLWKRSHPGKIPTCRRCARSAETRHIAASRGFSSATGKSCSPRRSQTARISRRYTCAAQSRQGICRRFRCIRSPRMCSTMPLRWSTAQARFSPFAQSRFRREVHHNLQAFQSIPANHLLSKKAEPFVGTSPLYIEYF